MNQCVFFPSSSNFTHTHRLSCVCLCLFGRFDVDFITVVKTVQITIQIRIAEPWTSINIMMGTFFLICIECIVYTHLVKSEQEFVIFTVNV